MSDRVMERSAIALERFVTRINSSVFVDGVAEATVPWSYSPLPFTPSDIPWLIREARSVLLAQARHAQAAPPWAIPLPVGDEISPLLHTPCGPLRLLGHYACSLMMLSYDHPGHPSFHDYCCGVMSHPWVPDCVRDDVDLRAEFPAKELPGLSARLIWYGEGLPAQVLVELLGR